MLLQGAYFFLSLVGLYYGADLTLESAERVGKSWRLSPLLIGLFLVGFGTSLPEFFVSQIACYRGKFDMSLGNVLGSNVANVFLILGICGLILPLSLTGNELRKQFIFHLVVTAMLGGFLYFGQLNWITLACSVVYFAVYVYLNLFVGAKDEDAEKVSVTAKDYLLMIFGFILLYGSGELLIFSGSKIGGLFGVSEYAISAIFVAFGTSFPELVTALLACRRGKGSDLIVGNIIGSNIFNIAFVLGSVGIYQIKLQSTYTTEFIALAGVSLFFLLMALMKRSMQFFTGIFFLGVYAYFANYWL